MRNKVISISSDSDDEIPLKMVKMNGCTEDTNSYDSLCQHSIEACEFCDRISNNRFSSLIHNVRHIIIPLLNQTVFQCSICLHSFTSENNLSMHNLKKHPDVTIAHKPLVKEDNFHEWSTSQSSCHRNIKELPTHGPNHFNGEEQNVFCFGTKKDVTKNECIKNRLVFEDDDLMIIDDSTSDQLLSDLTTDCKVNLELFHTPWLNGDVDQFSGKSVHYDELVKPGVYRCKKCVKGFPSRYDLIVHESSHIIFKNSQVSLCVVCKKYLVGGKNDLRHHYFTFHKEKIEKSHPPETVGIAKLLFEENLEEKKTFDSKLLSLCELCFSFCKNKSSTNYECVNNISEIGKRFECEKCGQLFFEIKLVRRFVQRRLYSAQVQKKRKKTNEDRLKTIGRRFKMMKH